MSVLVSCSKWSAEEMQQCPEAYQKDKRIFGFVKDWASFIFDKAPFRACYSQCAIDWPKVLVKSVNGKQNLRPPDMHTVIHFSKECDMNLALAQQDHRFRRCGAENASI